MNGHNFDEGYVWQESTCTIPGDYCWTCANCGYTKHQAMPLKEHDYEKILQNQGDCKTPDTWKLQCRNCAHFYEENDYSQCENRHVFSTGSYQEFDEVTLEWVTVTVTKCGVCGRETERAVVH